MKHQEKKVLVFICPVDEKTTLRQHFARQEGLSEEEALRFYSDSHLTAVMVADVETYNQWVQEAYQSLCAA